MTTTIVGPLIDKDGMARQTGHYRSRDGLWETRSRQWATPSHGLRKRQANFIGVDLDHSHQPIGRLEHIERDQHGRVWAVATADDFDPPAWMEPLYFSPALVFNEHDGGDVEITSVGIVTSTAQLGSLPVQILRGGGVDYRGCSKRWSGSELDPHRRALIERAAEQHVFRSANAPIIVHDHDGLDLEHIDARERYMLVNDQLDEAWKHRPLRYRPGVILDVR